MNTCDLVIDWLDEYLEDTLDTENKKTFDAHLKACPACQSLVSDLQGMKEVLSDMPLVALPADFNETLHEKLVLASEEIKSNSKTASKNKIIPFQSKKVMPFVGLAAAFALFVGAGSQLENALWWHSPSSEQVAYDMASGVEGGSLESANMVTAPQAESTTAMVGSSKMAVAPTTQTADGSAPVSTYGQTTTALDATANRDLIRTGDVSLKVANIDQFTLDLQALIKESGGYVESSYSAVSPYYLNDKEVGSQLGINLVIRIPSTEFTALFDGVKKMGELTSSQQNVVDVTSQLTDLRASLENLKVREDRLKSLMAQAKNVTEVMAVEKELSSVRTQIDQLSASLKSQTQQVSLSTLYINAQESPEVANQFQSLDTNLWGKAVQGLVKNVNIAIRLLEQLFILVVAWLPAIVLLGLGTLGLSKTKTYKNWRTKK